MFGHKKQLAELKGKKEELDLAMELYIGGNNGPESKEALIVGQKQLIDKMSELLGI